MAVTLGVTAILFLGVQACDLLAQRKGAHARSVPAKEGALSMAAKGGNEGKKNDYIV